MTATTLHCGKLKPRETTCGLSGDYREVKRMEILEDGVFSAALFLEGELGAYQKMFAW